MLTYWRRYEFRMVETILAEVEVAMATGLDFRRDCGKRGAVDLHTDALACTMTMSRPLRPGRALRARQGLALTAMGQNTLSSAVQGDTAACTACRRAFGVDFTFDLTAGAARPQATAGARAVTLARGCSWAGAPDITPRSANPQGREAVGPPSELCSRMGQLCRMRRYVQSRQRRDLPRTGCRCLAASMAGRQRFTSACAIERVMHALVIGEAHADQLDQVGNGFIVGAEI